MVFADPSDSPEATVTTGQFQAAAGYSAASLEMDSSSPRDASEAIRLELP